MEDDKSNAERPDLNQLNDAAKKAIENVAKEAVKAGRFVLASMAITNMDGNLSNTLRRLKKMTSVARRATGSFLSLLTKEEEIMCQIEEQLDIKAEGIKFFDSLHECETHKREYAINKIEDADRRIRQLREDLMVIRGKINDYIHMYYLPEVGANDEAVAVQIG